MCQQRTNWVLNLSFLRLWLVSVRLVLCWDHWQTFCQLKRNSIELGTPHLAGSHHSIELKLGTINKFAFNGINANDYIVFVPNDERYITHVSCNIEYLIQHWNNFINQRSIPQANFSWAYNANYYKKDSFLVKDTWFLISSSQIFNIWTDIVDVWLLKKYQWFYSSCCSGYVTVENWNEKLASRFACCMNCTLYLKRSLKEIGSGWILKVYAIYYANIIRSIFNGS